MSIYTVRETGDSYVSPAGPLPTMTKAEAMRALLDAGAREEEAHLDQVYREMMRDTLPRARVYTLYRVYKGVRAILAAGFASLRRRSAKESEEENKATAYYPFRARHVALELPPAGADPLTVEGVNLSPSTSTPLSGSLPYLSSYQVRPPWAPHCEHPSFYVVRDCNWPSKHCSECNAYLGDFGD